MVNINKKTRSQSDQIYYKQIYSVLNEINLFLKNNSNDLNSINFAEINSLRIKTSRFRYCYKVGNIGNKAIFKELDSGETFVLRDEKYNQAISRGVRLPEWKNIDNRLVIVASVYEFNIRQGHQRDNILKIESWKKLIAFINQE